MNVKWKTELLALRWQRTGEVQQRKNDMQHKERKIEKWLLISAGIEAEIEALDDMLMKLRSSMKFKVIIIN